VPAIPGAISRAALVPGLNLRVEALRGKKVHRTFFFFRVAH